MLGVCFLLGEAPCQNQKAIDSLKAVLAARTGGGRYSPLYDLAFQYLDIDNKRAFEFIGQAEAAALLSGDSLWIVKSKRVKGQILYKLERTAECIPLFETALAIAGRNNFKQECLMISNTFGTAYLYRGQLDKALEKFIKAFEYAEEQGDTRYLPMTLGNIGVTYYLLEDFRKALTYLLKGVDMGARMKRPVDYYVFVNISLCYVNLKEFSKAEVYLQKSLKECETQPSDKAMMHTKFASGFLLKGLKKYDQAMDQFLSSYSFAKKVNDTRFILDNIVLLSGICIRKNELMKANEYLQTAENVIQKGAPFPKTILDIYSRQSEVYMRMGKYKDLANSQRKYIQLRDSIFNADLTTRLMTAEAEFRERENKAKIEAQSEIILLKEEAITRQQRLNLITGLLGVITLVFSIFLFLNFRRKKRLNILLERKIRERTLELELSRDELLKVIREKDAKIYRATGMIADSVNTIEGLCVTARKETSDPVTRSYLRMILKTSDRIANDLQTVFKDAVLLPSA